MMNTWCSKPHQTEPRFLEWAQQYPQYVRLDSIRQLEHTAYAVTITDREVPDEQKRKCLITVPHAHEPGGTVACMNFLSQLLEGYHLDGTPSPLDRARILSQTLLTFIPDGNPEGRSRSPEEFWDGSKYSNEEFLCYAFGIDTEGKRFKRVDRWHPSEEECARAGIAYERIGENTYVEPNRDWDSSFFRLVHLLIARHTYDQLLDLHQTEFENSPCNCEILLPVVWDDLPEHIRTQSSQWAQEITGAWGEMSGGFPRQPQPLSYVGEQRRYFEQRWGAIYHSMSKVTVEVQNNNLRTPPDLQRLLAETAIRVSVERMLAGVS